MDFIDAVPAAGFYVCSDECMIICRSFGLKLVKTCGSFAEVKKPEHALKLFVRFAIAKGVITNGLELMMALLQIVQGVTGTIMKKAGFGKTEKTVLPDEIVKAVEDDFDIIQLKLVQTA